MSDDGEYKVTNKHGDVVQRGGAEVVDAGPGWIKVANKDAKLREGDHVEGYVELSSEVQREVFGDG